jgi:anti-sigma B factor antagonist
MNSGSAKLSVLIGERFACIKISGRANFSSSVDFRTVVNELRQKGFNYFVLDLSECVLMDSTFLGVLAGFGLKLNKTQTESTCEGIELFNPNARISEGLESLGIIHLFRIIQGPLDLPKELEARCPETVNATREEVTRACLEAHQTLMDVNPENVKKFKEVTQFLAEDLKRLKAAS